MTIRYSNEFIFNYVNMMNYYLAEITALGYREAMLTFDNYIHHSHNVDKQNVPHSMFNELLN